MANLSITAANVGISAATSITSRVQVAEAVTQGQPVYLDSVSQKYYKCDSTTAAKALSRGIVLSPSATDGYSLILTQGALIAGATLVVGETYVVSATSGLIAPVGDLSTGNFVTQLGVASTASVLVVDINATGVQRA